MSSLLTDIGGGVIGGLLVMITYILVQGRRRRSDAGAGAQESVKGTHKEHSKRIKRLEIDMAALYKHLDAQSKITDQRERFNLSVEQRFSNFRREIVDTVRADSAKQLQLLEKRIENRIPLSSPRTGPTINTGGVLAIPTQDQEGSRLLDRGTGDRQITDSSRTSDTQALSPQHATREPEQTAAGPTARGPNERDMPNARETCLRPSETASEPFDLPRRPQAAPERMSRGEISQLILNNFDEIDANSARQLDLMKRMYSALAPQITDIEDCNGAYLFKDDAGFDWFVHPRPNASLDHYWERAFPRAESYSRVIQRVTGLARIHRTNDQEYEVLQEGSFVVR